MAKSKSEISEVIRSTEPDPSLYYGKDSFILPNGDSYEGDYCAHRIGLIWREGHGIYKTHDGQTYEGEWKDDKLIENKELIIKYTNGAEYYGCLSKNKYKGPGIYTLECKMDLSCNFEENKPSGTVVLVDYEDRLWVGEAKEDKAVLLPENIFYLNITEDNGKEYPLEEQTASMKSTENEKGKEEIPELTDREWEEIIFKKSSKTENDVDFSDSKWVKKFEKFRERKEVILQKLDESVNLTNEEHLWIEKFEKYQANKKKKEADSVSLKRKTSEETLMLIEKFRSLEYNKSCPGVSVIYASPDLREEITKEESEKQICEESEDEDLFENTCIQEKNITTEPGSNVTILSYYGLEGSAHFKSDRLENLIKLKDYVKKLEVPRCKLHFTEEREKRRAEIREKLIRKKEEAVAASKFSVKVNERSRADSIEQSKEKKKDLGKKSKDVSEDFSFKKNSSDKGKATIDEKVEMQERIKQYIEEYFEEKVKIKKKEELETVLPKEVLHTHNIGISTEITDEFEELQE